MKNLTQEQCIQIGQLIKPNLKWKWNDHFFDDDPPFFAINGTNDSEFTVTKLFSELYMLKLYYTEQRITILDGNSDDFIETELDFSDNPEIISILNLKPHRSSWVTGGLMDSNQDVFISHSSADSKLAYAICDYLEEKGIRCWIAPRNVQGGTEYAEAIIMGIRNCKIMVVLFNKNANDSIYVKNEVERAFNYKTILIPFKLDQTVSSAKLELFLGSVHSLDATKGNPEAHFDLLYQNCARALGKKESPIKEKPILPQTHEKKENPAIFKEIDLFNEPEVIKLITTKNESIDNKIKQLIARFKTVESIKANEAINELTELSKKSFEIKIEDCNKFNSRYNYLFSVGSVFADGTLAFIDEIGENGLVCKNKDLEATMTWDEAISSCAKLGEGWRLPTKKELNYMYKNNLKNFRLENYFYWSSEEFNNSTAWGQNLNNVSIYDKTSRFNVRAVRTF